MAIENMKFSFEGQGDFYKHKVADLPDRPSQAGKNAQELKAAFDDAAVNVIAPRVNAIIDALLAATPGDSGAHSIGSAPIEGVSGDTVYAQLAQLQQNILGVEAGVVINDSVHDAQLGKSADDIYHRFAAHQSSLSAHFLIARTEGTASAYTLSDGSSAWSDLSGKICLFLARAHAACGANATMAICGGPELAIYPNTGGGLLAGQMRLDGIYLLMWNPANSLLYLLNPETRDHTHPIDQVANLQTALDGKSPTSHNHAGTYQPVGSYAPTAHGHAVADVSGLLGTLDGKSSTSHNHSGVYQPVGSYAAAAHDHDTRYYTEAEINSLLAGKQASGSYAASAHGHAKTDVGGLQDDLNYLNSIKSNTDHTHDGRYAWASHGHAAGDVGIVYSGGDPGVVEGRIWLKPI